MPPGITSLREGSHEDPAVGVCLNEAVALAAGLGAHRRAELHQTAHAKILADFTMAANDKLTDGENSRDRLMTVIPMLANADGQKQEETVRRVLCNRIFQRWIPAQMKMAGFGETAGRVRNAQGLEAALKKTLEAKDTIAGGRNPDTGEYLENKSDPVVMTLLAGLEQLEDNERRMDLGETAAEVAEDTLLVIVHGGQPEEDFDLVQEYLETIREACGRP